jgi:hypothetical protein
VAERTFCEVPMATDTLTLKLQGNVSLDDFAKVVSRFDALVKGLANLVAPDERIDWTVEDLQSGSAEITAVGTAQSSEPLIRVRSAYLNIGRSLEADEPVAYPPGVRDSAEGIRAVLNGQITAAIFETVEDDAIVRTAPHVHVPTRPALVTKGAVSGRIQTLTNRGSLRFTLYDLLHDKAVSCYLAEGREDLMRDAWGKLAVVEGIVRRDPLTGRPIAIRGVTAVGIRPDPDIEGYRAARGALPWHADAALPEDVIRRMRDA